MCTNGTQVLCEVPSLPNPTTRKGWPHHRGLRPLLFSNSGVGSFTSHKNKSVQVLWDGTTGFRPYPRRLESLTTCRCHYKGSAFFSVILRPRVLFRPGFEPATSRSPDRRSPNWAYQAALKCVLREARHELFCVFRDFYASGTQETKGNKITEHVGPNSLKLRQKSCLESKNRSHYWFLIDELFHNPVRGE